MPSKKQLVNYEQADTTIPPDNTTKSNSKRKSDKSNKQNDKQTKLKKPKVNDSVSRGEQRGQSEPEVPASRGGDATGEPVPEANMKAAMVGRSVQSEPASVDVPASQVGDTMKEAVVGQSVQTEPAGVDMPASQGDYTAVDPVPEANMKESVVELDDDFEPIDLEAFEDQLK